MITAFFIYLICFVYVFGAGATAVFLMLASFWDTGGRGRVDISLLLALIWPAFVGYIYFTEVRKR